MVHTAEPGKTILHFSFLPSFFFFYFFSLRYCPCSSYLGSSSWCFSTGMFSPVMRRIFSNSHFSFKKIMDLRRSEKNEFSFRSNSWIRFNTWFVPKRTTMTYGSVYLGERFPNSLAIAWKTPCSNITELMCLEYWKHRIRQNARQASPPEAFYAPSFM